MGLEGNASKRAKAAYKSGPWRNWLKTKNYSELELAILGIVQEAGNPTMVPLGSLNERNLVGSAAVVLTKLTRDLFWQAVELLADPDKKKPDNNMTWLNPGLVGRADTLPATAGSDTRRSGWRGDGRLVLLCHKRDWGRPRAEMRAAAPAAEPTIFTASPYPAFYRQRVQT